MAGIFLLLIVSFASCCIPSHPIEAGLVLNDMAKGGKAGSLQRQRPEPRREAVRFSVEGRAHQGDLYVSGDDWKSGLVLVPGAAEEGKDDPRLVAFAGSLARARFAVLVPDMPNVRRFQLGERDIRDIADSVTWFASREDFTRGKGVGIAAASYAVGPAVLAALEPDARRHLSFVFGVGGFYDLERAITFLTTGGYQKKTDSVWRHRKVDTHAKWRFALSNASRLRDAADGERLARLARARLADPNTPVPQLAAQLGPDASAIHRLLLNEDPARVGTLLQHVPDYLLTDWKRLNPSAANLHRLQARLILIHGRDDTMIPYTESIALADAAPRARVFLVDALAHVDLERLRLVDAVRLWQAVGALLSERGREAPQDLSEDSARATAAATKRSHGILTAKNTKNAIP